MSLAVFSIGSPKTSRKVHSSNKGSSFSLNCIDDRSHSLNDMCVLSWNQYSLMQIIPFVVLKEITRDRDPEQIEIMQND